MKQYLAIVVYLVFSAAACGQLCPRGAIDGAGRTPLLGTPNDEVVFGNNVAATIAVSSARGSPTAELGMTQAKLPQPSASSGEGVVVTVYEPASHLFWWTFQHTMGPMDLNSEKARFLRDYRFAMDRDRIVGFVGDGRSVWVRVSRTRAPSMAAALDEVGRELGAEASQINSGKLLLQQFNLSQVLGLKYFAARSVRDIGGPAGPGLRVQSATKQKDGWHVKFANDWGETRTIVFDDSFATVSAGSKKSTGLGIPLFRPTLPLRSHGLGNIVAR